MGGLINAITGKRTRVQFIQNASSTVIQLDASLKETHSRKSTLTKFPVENGQTISDHIIIEPFEISINGIITDTPIGDVQGLLTELSTSLVSSLVPPIGVVAAAEAFSLFSALADSSSPSVAAYGQLLMLQTSGQIFDLLTSLYRYPSMVITDVSVPRDSGTGDSLIFTVQCSQIILVSPQSVNIQIFANPALSANQGDLGQQGLGLPNGFAAGQAAFNRIGL